MLPSTAQPVYVAPGATAPIYATTYASAKDAHLAQSQQAMAVANNKSAPMGTRASAALTATAEKLQSAFSSSTQPTTVYHQPATATTYSHPATTTTTTAYPAHTTTAIGHGAPVRYEGQVLHSGEGVLGSGHRAHLQNDFGRHTYVAQPTTTTLNPTATTTTTAYPTATTATGLSHPHINSTSHLVQPTHTTTASLLTPATTTGTSYDPELEAKRRIDARDAANRQRVEEATHYQRSQEAAQVAKAKGVPLGTRLTAGFDAIGHKVQEKMSAARSDHNERVAAGRKY